ncbi:MAG: T9SS type A sorting domain-containing protein, partial [Sphingobacteriales bacterium]
LAQKLPAITLTVPGLHGNSYQLELIRYDFFSKDFKVRTVANGFGTDFSYTPGVYYRGVVKGENGSIASVSFFNDEVYAIFSMPGQPGNFVIAPNTLLAKKDASHYLLYNDIDIKTQRLSAGCATDKLPLINTAQLGSQKNTYSTCKDVEQYLVIDYGTYTREGGNAAAVTTLSNYITAVYNMLATLYRNEGIYTSIKLIDVNTTADPYQALPNESDKWLFAFGDEIQNNMHGADLAMLITDKNGGMGGIAWLGVLCANYNSNGSWGPYGFVDIDHDFTGSTLPTYHWDIQVMTHEMGHNLGSPHTHACEWNGNSTNIDGCAPTANAAYREGTCPIGPVPTGAVGGTIMSYCHLLNNVGIKITNGFGPQPAQLMRDNISNSACATQYMVSRPVNVADSVLVANRECEDDMGVTYYWNDNNNGDESDDVIALSIKKNGNEIYNLDSSAAKFDVRVVTGVKYGSGKADTIKVLSTITGMKMYNVAAARYWKIIAKQPTTNVELMFPFTKTDLKDIDGGVGGKALVDTNLWMYSLNRSIYPAASGGLPGATALDIITLPNGAVVSPTQWSVEVKADTFVAHTLTKFLYGGSMFYSFTHPVSVANVNAEANVQFYPNPTATAWTVWVPASVGKASMTLYSVDGKEIAKQVLQADELNTVNATSLPAGVYYYRVAAGEQMFTGTLKKQ